MIKKKLFSTISVLLLILFAYGTGELFMPTAFAAKDPSDQNFVQADAGANIDANASDFDNAVQQGEAQQDRENDTVVQAILESETTQTAQSDGQISPVEVEVSDENQEPPLVPTEETLQQSEDSEQNDDADALTPDSAEGQEGFQGQSEENARNDSEVQLESVQDSGNAPEESPE